MAVTGKEGIVAEKGYFILPSQLFENVRKVAPTDENLNVTLQGIFSSIESSAGGTASERDFKGLFDDIDVNSRKLGGSVAERKTFFIDATAEFVHEGNKNKLSPENIAHIHEAYQDKQERQYFSRLVDNVQIADNDYNLSVSSYVEQEDKREKVDIGQLNARIDEIVGRESVLRSEIDKIIAELEA